MAQADDTQLKELRKQAKQTVDRFVRRFDESYRLLAYHAALPLVLTPELVNYLRNEFLRNEKVPWVAEVDLLLSDLCSQVGYEIYAMDTHVRAYLLEEMKQDSRFGKLRMQEVAQVLSSYVDYLSRLNPGKRQQELEAQRLAAMVYLGDDQCKAAAREIAQRLLDVSMERSSTNLTESGIRAELARLTRITEELSPQLQQEPSLLEFARLVQRVLRSPEEVSLEEISLEYHIDNVELKFPDRILPEKLAEALQASRKKITRLEGFPPLSTFNFEVATITIENEDNEDEIETPEGINLQPFSFEVATIELKKSDLLKRNTELIVNRRRQQANGFSENLPNEIILEMVLIPGGKFTIGAPKDQEGSRDNERPQHQVTVPTFFMGKYPITQAQWQAVASLPQVDRKLNPNPSYFKGNNRPVERVSWFDAVEFCQRISQYTSLDYRLPSEAEWEYACRARSSTPFHFGQTITSELANYNTDYTYGAGAKGTSRRETTDVGHFGVANGFGLYDMHGNVWEWCLDHWHSNYEGAPTDGSAWLNDNDNYRLLRGGSWNGNPVYCRSAYRLYNFPVFDNYYDLGFRVVCAVVPGTLSSP